MPILLPQREIGLAGGDALLAVVGTKDSQPRGLEAVLEFNTLYFHDLKVIDKYRLVKISGFHGLPEIRDSREPNPQAHGETAFNAFFSGRTMVLEGRIEAHTIWKLRDMQQALRTAFADLTEHPLIIRTPSLDTDVQINCRTLGLVMEDQQSNFEHYRDFQITLRASDPRFVRYIETIYDAPFGVLDTFAVNDVVDGGGNVIGDVLAPNYAYDFGGGTLYVSGNQLVPRDTTTKEFFRDTVPKQADWQTTLKFRTPASVGVPDLAVVVKEIDVNNKILIQISASTIFPNVRIAGSGTGYANVVYTLQPNTDYWLRGAIIGNVVSGALYTADPSVGSPAPVATVPSYTLSSGEQAVLGSTKVGYPGFRVKPGDLNWRYDNFQASPQSIVASNTAFVIRNTGNFDARPIARIYGPVTAPKIKNNSTGEQFELTGSIPAGSYYEIDFGKKTVKEFTGVPNDVGTSRYSQVPITAEFFGLQPQTIGDNDISLSASSSSGVTPALRFYHRDTWV